MVDSIKTIRTFSVNLSRPVPGGGGAALGTITSRKVGLALTQSYLVTRWRSVGDTLQNLHGIAVGQTVTAAQMNVGFDIKGRMHILQMGPRSFGTCHTDRALSPWTGTSSGTIYRASQMKWVMDLAPGSIGRLFDIQDGIEAPVDKGLYYLRLHHEIGR